MLGKKKRNFEKPKPGVLNSEIAGAPIAVEALSGSVVTHYCSPLSRRV